MGLVVDVGGAGVGVDDDVSLTELAESSRHRRHVYKVDDGTGVVMVIHTALKPPAAPDAAALYLERAGDSRMATFTRGLLRDRLRQALLLDVLSACK